MRVALDLLGGDDAPGVVVAGALRAAAADPALRVALVGPPDVAARALADAGAPDALTVVPASQVVTMSEDPARGVRAKRDATVRVAARLVRDGGADACVSFGSTGAALAAALFTLGRLPGVTRPALAATLPSPRGRLVLLDVGGTVDAGPDLLTQFALTGAAYAQLVLGVPDPRVGLLSVGSEPGKGDQARKDAHAALAALAAVKGLPLRFVGNVEGGDVPLGGRADVVVTDGFTGNVLLKGLEGAVDAVLGVLGSPAAPGTTDPGPAGADAVRRALGTAGHGGAVLLGVNGLVVIGHGAADADAVASGLAHAAAAVRVGLLPQLRTGLGRLLAARERTTPPPSPTAAATAAAPAVAATAAPRPAPTGLAAVPS